MKKALTCTILEVVSVQHFVKMASKFLIRAIYSRSSLTISLARQPAAKTLVKTPQNRKDKFPTPNRLAILVESTSKMKRIVTFVNTHFVLGVGHYKLPTGIINSLPAMCRTKRLVANWQ
jgi:hypothetical protein